MLSNKVIVVTGGAGFLGQEFVRSIAGSGGTCVVADSNPENGKKISAEVNASLGKELVYYLPLDITSKESVSNLVDAVKQKHGKIDALVNNAYPRNKKWGAHFFDVTYADFCENLNLHLAGYFLTSQQFAAFFKEQGYGNIINMASVYGVSAPKFEVYEGTKMTVPVEYAAIKSGIIHLSKYMAKYLKGSNIRVNCLSPGGILDQQPESFLKKYKELCLSKGMLDPSDISGTLLFLLSDLSLHINGQNIVVDDGFTL